MQIDPWHYPRTELAKQVIGMFDSGLSSALIFFAPRRMGKTEFLLKDILPIAKKSHWKTFYFSFLDVGKNAKSEFSEALIDFSKNNGVTTKAKNVLGQFKKISGETVGIKAGIELREPRSPKTNIKNLIARISKQGKILLLMDEVQILSKNKNNEQFVASLRTALDIYKDNIKVIFTGSSREELRRMFSQANAPFFHFGQNLPFPELGQEFTNHLAAIFKKVTKRQLEQKILWSAFQEMGKVPQLARSLVERLALNPNLSINEAKIELLSEISNDRAFEILWESCSALERLLLIEISMEVGLIFSIAARNKFAEKLGLAKLPVSSIQSAIRSLQRKNLIGRHLERGSYFIDDPIFKDWLLQIH